MENANISYGQTIRDKGLTIPVLQTVLYALTPFFFKNTFHLKAICNVFKRNKLMHLTGMGQKALFQTVSIVQIVKY